MISVGGLCPIASMDEVGSAIRGITLTDRIRAGEGRANRRRTAEAAAACWANGCNAQVAA